MFAVELYVSSGIQLPFQLPARFHVARQPEDAAGEGSFLIKEAEHVLWGSKGGQRAALHTCAQSQRGWRPGSVGDGKALWTARGSLADLFVSGVCKSLVSYFGNILNSLL